MFSTTLKAEEIAKIFERALIALDGSLNVNLNSTDAITMNSIKAFQVNAIGIAKNSYTDTINSLSVATDHLCREARLRAYRDANIDAPAIIIIDADLSTVDLIIKQHHMNEVHAGVKVLKQMMGKYRLLVSSGLKPSSAKIRVHEMSRGNLLNVYKQKSKTGRVRSSWAVYLRIAQFLNTIVLNAYIEQAVSLGFTNFEIVQFNHDRDGLKFTADNVPMDELHPQNLATVKLVREA